MNKLRLLRIWNRLKRQLRSLIIRLGTRGKIVWKDEFVKFMAIMTAVADIQDSIPDTLDSSPATECPSTTDSPKHPATTDSPYDTLVPSQQSEEPAKKRWKLFGRWSQQ